ncbi:MAG: hypothetical protein K2N65_03635, partial [Anaeroplasmataceae bacterium]|nr:hypothetical protein [Anaeroplasmataceae bacterium]
MKKIITIILLALCFFFFTGCNQNKYNATLDSNAKQYINKAFLNENRVKGAYYLNDAYIEGESDPSEKYILDTASPSSRTFQLEEEKFNDIFSNYPFPVDFEKEMVVLYIFTDIYPRKYNLDGIDVNGTTLNIYYKLEQGNKKDAVEPYQRCFLVKLNILEIDT